MFMFFQWSFGKNFLAAASILLGMELFGCGLSFVDFEWFYEKFREPDLYDDG
jgi:hypothetical protein